MRYLKQSTSADVGIGPFLDATDGVTAETALTITQPDVRLKKNNGNWAQKAAAQTLTHEENGWYEVTLDATDTDTIGTLLLAVHESGALPVWHEFHVLAANVYDSLFGAATDKLQADVVEINSSTSGVAGLDRSARSIVRGTATTGGTTTSIPTSSLDPAAAVTDQFKGRIVIFDRDTTTANLRGQATDITANTSGGTLTVTALTTSPASGDTFCIV